MTKPWTIDDLKKSPCAVLNPHLFTPAEKPKKKSKYRNCWVEIDGFKFQSKKEGSRYLELKMLQHAGLITGLELQKKYLLIEATETEKKCEYWADFFFIDADGNEVVEDVKSPATRRLSTYILKRKLMAKVHGITLIEK